MHNPESVLEKETNKILWDFEIQMDYLISARRLNLVIMNKKKRERERERTCRIVDFEVPADHKVKLKESEKKYKYIDFTKEHESDGDTNCNWCARYSHQRIGVGTGGLGNERTSGDHPNYSLTEIGQNIKKGPGDLRTLAVTQTLVENHQLMLVRKTIKLEK